MQVRKALDQAPYTCEEAVLLKLVDGSAYRYSAFAMDGLSQGGRGSTALRLSCDILSRCFAGMR